jgi:hypothetical protein
MGETISTSQLLDLVLAHPATEVHGMLADALRASGDRPIPISSVRSSDFRRIYQVRWKRIQETGIPESRGFAEFVGGLSDDSSIIWMFDLRADDWLFVGYLPDGLLKIGGILALKSDRS